MWHFQDIFGTFAVTLPAFIATTDTKVSIFKTKVNILKEAPFIFYSSSYAQHFGQWVATVSSAFITSCVGFLSSSLCIHLQWISPATALPRHSVLHNPSAVFPQSALIFSALNKSTISTLCHLFQFIYQLSITGLSTDSFETLLLSSSHSETWSVSPSFCFVSFDQFFVDL